MQIGCGYGDTYDFVAVAVLVPVVVAVTVFYLSKMSID